MKNDDPIRGDSYKAVKFVYDKSPGRSWQRLNGALHETLEAAITARLTFKACTYKNERDFERKLKQGNVGYIDEGYRRIEDLVRQKDGTLILRAGLPLEYERSKVDRVFKIKYEELKARRKEYDKARKAILAEIESAANPADLDAISVKVSTAGRAAYRHFDIDDFNKAYSAKSETFREKDVEEHRKKSEAADLERWRAGEGRTRHFCTVVLRVNGNYVETSTGHSVTVDSARRVLPIALKRRNRPGRANGEQVDLHTIEEFTKQGVLVGCTLVPWPEVERLDMLLSEPAKTLKAVDNQSAVV